jgi:hypothetical protein
MAGDKCTETSQNDLAGRAKKADWAMVRMIPATLQNWNHSGASPLFWKIT